MIHLKSGSGPVMRGPQKSDNNSRIIGNYVTERVDGGVASDPFSDADAVFIEYTGATYFRGGAVVVQGLPSHYFVNLTPGVADISSDGTLTRLSSGVFRCLVVGGKLTLPFELDLRTKADEASNPKAFQYVLAGSLAEHLQTQVDDRLAAITGTPTMATNGLVFTTQNHSAQTYVRNPDLWCSQGTPIDLTCISPWNSNGAHRKAGALVTPRHVISAAHYEKNVGNTIRFVAMDGTVHNRTITGKKRHPDYVHYSPDLTIYTLASDLPATVTPCKLMPSNWNDYLVQNWYNRPPALGLDQEEKALIIDFNTNGSFLTPTNATRLIFHENKISGDSGNPAFLIVNDELVLVTVWTWGGAGSGTPVAAHIPALNQMIIDADTQAGVSTVDDPKWPNANGHYQLQPADFSAFPNYA